MSKTIWSPKSEFILTRENKIKIKRKKSINKFVDKIIEKKDLSFHQLITQIKNARNKSPKRHRSSVKISSKNRK